MRPPGISIFRQKHADGSRRLATLNRTAVSKVITAQMLQEERHRFILEQLRAQQKVHTEALRRMLKVSADTIRRDLMELEKEGRLLRVHGGAISVDFHNPFLPEEVYAREEKIQIARKALTLLRDGMTLIAGGGTVMLELARLFPQDLKATLFTVSPLVALEVAQRSSVEVILLAGRLSRNAYICTGASVVSQLSDIRADLCLMGTNGFSLKAGITDHDWEVVQVKKAMLRAADKTAVLSIAEKKDIVHKLKVCPIQGIHYLITERPPAEKQFGSFRPYCKVL